MRIVKAVIPFLLYAMATFVAMDVLAAAGGVALGWLWVSFPLLILAYAEAVGAVGFKIGTGRVIGYAVLGGVGRSFGPGFGFGHADIPGLVGAWILIEVGVVAGLLKNNVKHSGVWFLVGFAALAGEWLLFGLLFDADVFWPLSGMSVVQVESMRGRFRLLTLGLLSVDLVRNVGLFALAYRWRIKSELAEA
jgi:hypothetical protein